MAMCEHFIIKMLIDQGHMNLHDCLKLSVYIYVSMFVRMFTRTYVISVSVCKASELVAVKSKADEVSSQKAALDDHIATLKVLFSICTLTFMKLMLHIVITIITYNTQKLHTFTTI